MCKRVVRMSMVVIPVQSTKEAAVQQLDRPRQGLVDLVPPGGEDLDYDVGDEDQGDGDAGVEPQPAKAEGDRQDHI